MIDCATASQLQEIGESAVAEFDSRIAGIPADFCSAFHSEAMRLEGQLLLIYRLIVSCNRGEEDLGKIANRWGSMVGMCDLFAGRLHLFKDKHPMRGADVYYDRILDLRNKCLRLQKIHT